MISVRPASMIVLARLGAPACPEWELLCNDDAVLLVDRARTCCFEGALQADASGEAELAIVGGELHVRLPFACLRFDGCPRGFGLQL